MRFSITIILFACASLVLAQNNKISEDEKSRLENQFKALKTFYINDDGLVVYQKQSSDANINNKEEKTALSTKTVEKVKTPAESNVQPQQVIDKPTIKKESTNDPTITTPKQTSNYVINKRPVDPNTISTAKVEQASESNSSNKTQSIPIVDKNITKKTTPLATTKKIEEVPKKAENVQKSNITKEVPVAENTKVKPAPLKEENNLEENNTEKISKPKSNKSSYPYRKLELSNSPLKYKDMEEAAMAVDNLLDKLKKEQAQNTNSRSGSMSTKIARGAGKSTLRKETISDNNIIDDIGMRGTYDDINNNNTNNQEYDPEKYDDDDDLDVDVPTYYINGYEVDRSEVDKLKRRDIISRQIRVRNTISGNPAGEVWIEVNTATK